MKTSLKTTGGVRSPLIAGLMSLAAMAGPAVAQDANTQPTNGNLPPGAKATSWDPTYNVCRGVDPACYHDWAASSRQNRVLIYSRTAGPRHANLGTALAAGLNPPLGANNTMVAGLKKWLEAEGIAVDWTEDVTQLASLNKYKAVIFASPTRDSLWKHGTAVSPTAAVNTSTNAYLDAAKVNLRQYIRAGGGFVGIHNAFGTEYNWPWYEGLLGNANYYDHGANQEGTVQMVVARLVDRRPAVALACPRTSGTTWCRSRPTSSSWRWSTRTRWRRSARLTRAMGDFHPVSWCQYYDGGRAWLTTLGHDAGHFIDGSGFPGQTQFKQHVVTGIKSAMGLLPFCS